MKQIDKNIYQEMLDGGVPPEEVFRLIFMTQLNEQSQKSMRTFVRELKKDNNG